MVMLREQKESKYGVKNDEEKNEHQHIEDGRQGLQNLPDESSHTTEMMRINEKNGS